MYIKYLVAKNGGERMHEDLFEQLFVSSLATLKKMGGKMTDLIALKDLIVLEADKLGYDYIHNMDVVAQTSIAIRLLSHVVPPVGA